MESWVLHQNVVRRSVFSDRVSMRYILFTNKNRMHHDYVIHLEWTGVKPLSKTPFYVFCNDSICRNMTRETCVCTQCVEKDDVVCHGIRSVLNAPWFAETSHKCLDEMTNMQYFYERNYRPLLERQYSEMHQCLTFALSRSGTPFSGKCGHDHTNTMSVMGGWEKS